MAARTLAVGLVGTVLAGCHPFDSSYTYSVDGWCLRHSGENLEIFRAAAYPRFFVPADFVQTRRGYKGKQALIASYHKGSSLATTAPEKRPSQMGCDRVEQPTGLSLLVGEELPNCLVDPRRNRKFVPTNPTFEERTVFVMCGAREPPNCQITYILGDGWSADVIIPTSELGRWDEAVRVTRDYFYKYISDCGTDR